MRPAAALALLAFVWACAFAIISGYQGRPAGLKTLAVALSVIVIAAGWRSLRFLIRMWKSGETEPMARIREGLRPALNGFLPILAGIAIIGLFLASMSFIKSMIGAIVPFWADAPLAAIDRAAGIDPQNLAKLLQPWIREIGIFYGFWHFMQLGGILWVLHWANDEKNRLILAFMLTWVIGMIFAYLLSSAGPIFTGGFDPALAPESVRNTAAFLWANYKGNGALVGGGISAFPSMHVAIATWFALVLREKRLGWVGLAYLVSVVACSIILGWHYSADSVAGIAIALLADRLSYAWLRSRRANAARRQTVAVSG